MATQMRLYVRLRKNTPRWKKWLIDKSNWYKHEIAWKQPIWVVYDILNKKTLYPGGTTKNDATFNRDMIETARKNINY